MISKEKWRQLVGQLLDDKKHEQAKKLNKQITTCKKVKKILEDKVWAEIIQPLLDAMIEDTVGARRGNIYKNGHLCKPEGNYEYYVGYKQALMDFHNRVWNYVESIKPLTERRKAIEKTLTGEVKYINPMLEGKYVYFN